MMKRIFLIGLILGTVFVPVAFENTASASHLPEGDSGNLLGANWFLQWEIPEDTHDGVRVNFADYNCCNFLFDGSVQYIGVKYTNKWNFDHLCHWADDTIPPDNPPDEPGITEWEACAAITDFTEEVTSTYVRITAKYFWADVYEYVQTWEFTNTGVMKNHLRFFGPGQCEGDNCSSYWPIWRMDFDVEAQFSNKFYECIGGTWQHRTTEGTFISTGTGDYCSGKEWRQRHGTVGNYKYINMWPVPRDEDSSKYLNPPRMHAVQYGANEWDGGAGPYSYWPTQYVNGQSIDNQDVVVWYEARMKWKEACERGGTEVCTSGFRATALNY